MAWIETLQDNGYTSGSQIYTVMSALITQLECFHITFCTTEERLEIFKAIAIGCDQLLNFMEMPLLSSDAPAQVASISGVLQTQVGRLPSIKTGRKNQTIFADYCATFVRNTATLSGRLNDAIRTWEEYFPPAAAAPRGAAALLRPAKLGAPAVTAMLIQSTPIADLRTIVARLNQFPARLFENDSGQLWQVTRRAFAKHRPLTFSGVILFILAAGAGLQIGFESVLSKIKNETEARDPRSALFLVGFFLLACILLLAAFVKSWQQQPRRPLSRGTVTHYSKRELDRQLLDASASPGGDDSAVDREEKRPQPRGECRV